MKVELQPQNARSVLRIERRLTHPPEKVWRALTEPAHLNQWFPFDVEIELQRNGQINFNEKGSTEPSSTGEITELEPPRVLAYRWGDDMLRWELQPTTAGCLLIFTQIFDDRAGAASFAAGWQVCIDAMEKVLDGRPIDAAAHVTPGWRQHIDELHESYIDALALGKGTAELTADGWQVHFERQLTKPIDRVWAKLIASGNTPAIGDTPPTPLTTTAIGAGMVTAVTAPTLLEYTWQHHDAPQGRVRWELKNGTGHGARLLLTQTGPRELAAERFTALTAWQAHIERFAKGLLDQPQVS